jgi:ATP-dependent RNA helicase RhlE
MEFKDLSIIDQIIAATKLIGYTEATPIQEQAIPLLLEGKDVLASAQTGTGKTASFAIPILQQLYLNKKIERPKLIKVLVLTPTRELASQIAENFTLYSKYLGMKNTVIFGGVPQKKQEVALQGGTDILTATPGRLLDLVYQGIINLDSVKYLVLDEADQMLDMGFIHDVRKIVNLIPKERQTMLFSATMPKSIEKLAEEVLKDPVRVSVTPVTQTLDAITQSVYHVPKKQKPALLMHLIDSLNVDSALVFTRTKQNANRLVKTLVDNKISAEPIHGNKSQAARERALLNFKKGRTKILVATDIAARGLDIDALSFVFNYELPEVPETYIHRIGRTGRAGLSGMALAFCDPAEKPLLLDIEKHIKSRIDVIEHQFNQLIIEEKKEVYKKVENNKKGSTFKESKFKKESSFKPKFGQTNNNKKQSFKTRSSKRGK